MLTNLENKILYLPVDLPKFPVVNFYTDTDTEWNFWNFKKLTEKNITPYSATSIKSNFIEDYPDIINWLNNFPFLDIINIKFNVQLKTVRPHIDFVNPHLNENLFENNQINEPCGYRVLINGSRSEKLYILNKNKKVYATLPNQTDVYVIGQTSCLHGVEEDIDRRSLYLHFFIDKNKHNYLLKKSWKKYKKYAILQD